VSTIEQMAGMHCERSNLTLREDAKSRGDISGVMGLAGEAEGFVAITFPNQLARKIVCKMLQMELGEESEADIMDGVGEMMNMIAGAAKAELIHTQHSFQLSIPNVIVGGPHGLGHPRGGTPVVVIEFNTEDELFEVLVCIKPRAR
jgi:chemotaxis protein CheX